MYKRYRALERSDLYVEEIEGELKDYRYKNQRRIKHYNIWIDDPE